MILMNLLTKQTHRYRKKINCYQMGRDGRDKLGVWVNRYTLLYIINKQGPAV